MLIIGERINASRKTISQAISSLNEDLIKKEVRAQAVAGADYIEVNAGTFLSEEVNVLSWLIEVVQDVTDLPLCIDSPDPKVIKSVLPLLKTPAIINSITLETTRLEGILPLVKDYEAKVIALCQSGDRLAETTDAKVEMADILVNEVTEAGISLEDLYIDPLVYPLSTNSGSALAALDAIHHIMKQFPGVHTICGLSNISHGLPNRSLINRTFLAAAMARGLDSAIMDPTDKQIYGTLKAAHMIVGKDDFCMQFINDFREGKL